MAHLHLRIGNILGLAGLLMLASADLRAESGRHRGGGEPTRWADVVDVTPIEERFEQRIPRESCWTEQVRQERERYARDDSYLGPVLGGVIGGALGNAVGHQKRNKQVGAAVGAIVGATVGHEITRQRTPLSPEVYYTSERRCETTYDVRQDYRTVGYWVTYRYYGEEYRTRLSEHPGDRLRVRVAVEPY